jgi:hypothetical protein
MSEFDLDTDDPTGSWIKQKSIGLTPPIGAEFVGKPQPG